MQLLDNPEFAAFQWLTTKMGLNEWENRRAAVIHYLEMVDASVFSFDGKDGVLPIAVYSDWMAWYLFLIETSSTYPWHADHIQLARIKPFFNAIGRGLIQLNEIGGSEARIKSMLHRKRNQPDAALFELVVALTYFKNGWKVTFLEESKVDRMPDFVAEKQGQCLYVECKRLAKVNDYAELERQAWLKRWSLAGPIILETGLPVAVNVEFDIPIEDTPDQAVADAIKSCIKGPPNSWGVIRAFKGFRMTLCPIDLQAVNISLNDAPAKHSSPALLEKLLGTYDYQANQVCLLWPEDLVAFGTKPLEILLSKSIQKLKFAAVGSWKSLSSESLDKKAKDIKKLLSKAVQQIPDNCLGAIHLGYETVLGPEVEAVRHEKIKETVHKFDYQNKLINAIYCHAIQPLATLEGFECAETVSFFIKDSSLALDENLLLDPPGLQTQAATHWDQDIERLNKGEKPK